MPIFDDDNNLPDPNAVVASQLANDVGATAPVDPQSVASALLRQHLDPNWPPKPDRSASAAPGSFDPSQFLGAPVGNMSGEDASQYLGTPVDDSATKAPPSEENIGVGGNVKAAGKGFAQEAIKAPAELAQGAAVGINAITPTMVATAGGEGSPLSVDDLPGGANNPPAEPVEQNPVLGKVYKGAGAVKDFAEKAVPMSDAEKASLGGQVGTGLGGMVAPLAATALGGPAAGAAVMGLQSAGQTYDAARKKGASPEDAATAAGLDGAVGAALGMLPLGIVLKPFEALMPAAGAGVSDIVTRALAHAAQSSVTFATVGEAQQYIAGKVAEAYYDPNGGYSWDTKRVLGELLTGGLIGFGSGLFHESLSVRARGAAVSDSIEHAKKYDGSTSDATNPDGMPRWQDDPNNWQNVGVGNGPGPQPNTGGGGAGAQPGGQQGSQQSGAQGGSQQGNPGTSAPDRAKEWHDAWGQTQGAAEPSNKRWSTLAGVMQNAYGFRSTDLKNASFSDLRNFMANADALTAAGFDKAAIAKMTPGDMAAAVLDIQMKAKGGAQADAQPGAQAQPEPTAKEAEDILRQHGYDDATIAGMDAGVRVKTAHGLRQAYPNGPQSQPGTSSSPIDLQTGADVARAAAVASTDHSHAQGEAGNRQSGHAVWNGLGVKFEVAAGGTRKGTVPDTGAPWETTHPHAYGEFKDLPNAADGMKPDVIVGDHPQAPSVYVIDEIDPQTGKYRQSKSFIGFQTPAEVAQSYAGISSKSMAGIGGMRAFGRDEFTKFAKDGGLSKPVTDLKAKSAEKSTGNQTENPENQTGNQPGNRTEQAAGSPINADLVRQLPDELMSPRILRAFEGMFDENGNRHTDIGIANNDPRATKLYNKAGITDPKLGLMTWQGLQALKAERARRDGKPFEASKPASKPGMAEDTPSAEPLADIQAQARDLADKKNRRGALWLPKDTVDHLSKLGKLDEVIGGHPAQHNFDGKGGILVARDLNTIAQAKKDKKAGRSIQEIVGRLVGAGSGKPADATHVVQQLDEQGNVTRERAVRESDVKRTYQAFSTPGRSVRVVSPEEAVKRRADLVSREAGIEQPAPEPRESSPHDHHAVAEELKQAGIDPAQVRPADIARAGEIHAEEGLAPLDAFAVAVLRHLVETGAVSREAVQGILGHERTAKLLDAINGDRGRRPARLEDASAAARRPAAEAQSGVSAGSDKQNAEAAASQSDEHGQAGQTVGTAGAEANGRERSVSDTGHSEAGGTELQAASGKQHAEPAGAHGAVGERAGAKPGSANGKAPAAAKNLKRKPWSILEYIGHRGGLKPSAEWEGMGLTFRSNVIVPNVGRRSLIKRDGMQVDRLIEALREGGYIENAPEDRPDDVGVMNHVYDLVEKDWAAHENKDESGKQYAIGVEPPISSAEQHRIDESWEEHGARTEEARGRLHSALDEAGIPVHSIGPSLEAETVRLMLDSEDAGEDHDPLDLLERAAVLLENERDLIHDDDTGVGEEVFHALDEERAPQASGADHAEIGEPAAEEEGGSGEVSGVSPERGESAGQEPGSAATERTEAGEQGVLPGAERIGQGEHAQRKSDEKLKPTKAQQPADHGLFGDSSAQTDLVDMAKAKPEGIAGELQGDKAAAETFRKVMEAGQPKDAAELLNRADDLFRSREDESARGGILDRVKRVLRTLQHGKSGYTNLEGALTQLRGTLDHITTEPEGDIADMLREKEGEGTQAETGPREINGVKFDEDGDLADPIDRALSDVGRGKAIKSNETRKALIEGGLAQGAKLKLTAKGKERLETVEDAIEQYHVDPVRQRLEDAGLISNASFDNSIINKNPSVEGSRLFKFVGNYTGEKGRPEITVDHPKMAEDEAIKQAAKIAGVKPVYDEDARNDGQWHHAVDLADDEGWKRLVETKEYTTPDAIARAVEVNLRSKKKTVGQKSVGLSLDNAKKLLTQTGMPDPGKEKARDALLAAASLHKNDKGKWVVNYHSKSPDASWGMIYGFEDGTFSYGRDGFITSNDAAANKIIDTQEEAEFPGKGTLANRIDWMLKNEDWTEHQWKKLVEKSTPQIALDALARVADRDLSYPDAYRASKMAGAIEDVANAKKRADASALKGKGNKAQADASPLKVAERAAELEKKFDAIQAKHVADAVKEKGITDRMPVKIAGGFYDGRTGARMSEVYGHVNLRDDATSLQIITAPRGDWTFIGPEEIRNDLSPATEEEVSKAHTEPQWQFPDEGEYSDEERRHWLADRLNAVASGDAEAELHDDYITVDGELVGQGINISSDKPKEIIHSFLKAAQKEAGLDDSDIVHIEQAINEQLEGQRAAAEEDRVAEEKKRADTIQGMKDVKAGKAVTDEVREILQDGGFIKGKGDKTKLSAKGEHQLTGLLKHEKEEAAEKAALDALPEPKDIKGLTKVYRDTIDELDFAVRQADGNAAGELFDKLTLIEQRANNNVTFGMAADDSPAEQVRQGGAVPIGSIPKWGQRGVFETEVGGVKAIVKSGFYLGDSIYAAGPGPFPSETGYRSFSHMHDIPEEALGHSVEEFAHKQIEHAIAEQKKSNKGKLGTPDTWYRLPKDWAETDEIGRRNGDPMVAGRTPEKEEQLAESRRMQERIRENGNEIDFPDDEEPETPTAETPSGVFPPSAVGTGAVEPFDSEKAIVDITRRIIEAANHVSTFTDLVRNDASNADLLKAFKQNIGSHVTGADINRVSATARGASLHLLMPGPDGETIKPVLSGAKLADAIREAAKAPETGPSDFGENIWADFRDGKKPTEFMGRPVPENAVPFKYAKAGDVLPDGKIVVERKIDRKARAQQLAEEVGGIVSLDGPKHWAVLKPTDVAATPEAETSDSADNVRSDLETKGAARFGKIDYKIAQLPDNGSFYFTRTENGVRVEKGPGYPARWNRETAIEQAMTEVNFDRGLALSEEPKKPNIKLEDQNDERSGTGKLGSQPLEGEPASDLQGSEAERDSERGASGSSTASSEGDRATDGEGLSGARGEGSSASNVHPLTPGGKRTKSGAGGRAGRNGAGVSEKPAGTDRLEPAVPPQDAPSVPAINYRITDETELGKGAESVKLADNLRAIETLKQVERETRRATPEEQRILARYVGWGGLANAFPDRVSGEYKPDWKARGEKLAALLTPAELKAAQRTTRNAHYTSRPVIDAMWKAAERLGFKGGLSLESSMGVGNFLGLVPESIAGRTRFVGVEFDSVTSRIAKLLYPQDTVLHSGFQRVPLSDGEFVLSIGNPPFGAESLRFQNKPELYGLSIHNQFFLASLDALRPGGLHIAVVSHFLLDAEGKDAREKMAVKADLLGAIRLPETAFKENARTEVVTDIVLMQRRAPEEQRAIQALVDRIHQSGHAKKIEDDRRAAREELARKVPWVETAKVKDPLGGEDLKVNTYFAKHPDMIMGRLERSGTMRGPEKGLNVVLDKNADLSKLLNEAVDKLPANKLDVDAETMQRTLERHKSLSESLKIALAGHEPGHLELNERGKLTQIYERETPSGDFEPLRREVTPDSPWSQDLMLDSDGRYYKLEPLLRAVQLKDMRLRVQAKLNELPKGSHERQGLTDQLKELDQQIKEAEKTGAKAKQGNRNIYARQYFPDNKVPEGMRLGKTKYDRLVDLTKLRDHTRKQIELETEDYPEADLEANRAKLARAYRDYTRENGLLHEKKTSQLLGEMPDGALVMSLEHGYRREITAAKAKRTGDKARPASAKQSAILSSRVVPKYAPPTKAGSAADAISIALSERGHLDVDRIADLLGTTKDEAEKALGDGDKPLAFYDPESQRWETRNGYLSGQVRRKLEAAKGAGLEKNVKALEEVQPERWNADQVTPIIGANWIPPKVYEDFVSHLLGTHATVQYGKATNAYNLLVGEYGNDKASQWGTQDLTPDTIIRNLLNSRPQKVMIPGDKDHGPTEDKEASALAQLKANEILSEFGDWVFRDGDRRNHLVDIYNDKFNTRVLRQHDGSHMTLPGKVPDQVIKMRRHQMNAAWRGVYDRFLLLDHVVGAGKTFTAIARAMERRRMGLSKKPMIVVPNHLVDQWAADVYRLYPGAKVLSAGNKQFDRKNRRRLFARIATGDWDVVIVPHSSFGFIGISPDTELRFLDEELRIALEAIDEAKKEAGSQTWPKPYTVKEAERLVTAIEGRMDALRNARRDNMLTFEQLGVDDLTVDEAHEFKNLFYSSHLQNVRGMGNKTGSKKASDLYNKVRVLRETPSSTVTFMTGTPISNSAVEMYTMMRYLAADELKALGIEHFDAWRNQYVSAEPKWEPTEAGGLKEVTRLGRSWSNMRALMELYYSFTDSVTQEDINKAYAEDNNGAQFPVPNVKSGGRKEIIVEPTPAQQQALQAVIEGFNSLPTIKDIDERNAERLRLMDRARKVSLDVRAVNPRNPSKEEGGKLDQISDNVARIYKQWDKDAGTQLIFLDRSVPKAKGDDKAIKAYDDLIRRRDEALASNNEAAYRDVNDELEKYDPGEIEELRRAQSGGWNAYDQIKQNLIKRGVKADEIRFVQDANNDAEKKALFEAVNDGTIRVLVGSTQRMGAGTNVQERLVALHHGDVTWKPSDIEQREGRIIRQGNKLLEKYGKAGHNGGPPFEVEILAYATKRTVDAKMWDLNAEKLKMINGIRKYDGAFNMNFEDEDSVSMAEIAALASGDPLLLERVKLSGEIDKLELAQRGFSRKMFGVDDAIDRANRVIRDYPQMAEEADKRSSVAKQDVFALREAAKKRAVTVEGETFNDQFAAAQKANTEIDRQRGDDENAKYSVNIDGKQLTSKEAITGAIHTALGDSSPFEAKIGGETYWQRFSAAKAIAEKLNSLAEETKEGDEKEIKLGRMFNADLIGILQGYRGAIGIGLVLSRDGKTVAASSMKDVGREKQDDLIESGIVSPALLRGRIEDLEKDFLGIASSNGDRYRNSIANATRDLPGLLEQKNEKFPQADRLSELRAKLREIIAELDRRTKEAEGNPSAPAIEKIDPDKFMPGELSSFDALANFGRMNSLEPYSPRLGQFAASAAPQEAPQSFSGQASRGLSNEAEARRLQELQAHRKLREQIPGTPEHEAAQRRVKIRKIAMAWLDHWTGGRFSTGDFKLFTHDMINSPPGVGGYGDTKMIGTIGGLYHPADMAVYIAMSDPSFPNVFRTLAHEGGLHLVLDHFATPQEWAVLRSPREQRRLAEIIAAKKRGFSVEDVLKWDPYEIDANAGEFYFDDLARGGKGNGFHAIIRRIFDKILNFFRALGNYLRNHGFDTADWIFDRAFHGEMGKRPSRINDLHEPSRIIDEIRAGREGQAAQARPYENVPDNLMGFRKEGPQKGYDETNYPHEQHVEVHHEGAEPFVDTIKGMNKAHALERARRNWGTNDVRAIEPPQTDTPQFKRWFGDSKVVDRNGEPKVVYHGTDADDFNSFARTEDIGFHFGTIDAANDRLSQTRPNDDPNVSWQDTRIMPVYLRIENPMRMSDLHDWNARQVLDDLEEAGILSEDQANEARENDVNIDRLFVQDALKAHGYDGIVYENNSEGRREIAPGVHERGDSYIVFDPTQIKSATGNNGAFTPDSPDIAMRRRAAAGPGSPKRSRNSRIRDAIDRILDSRLGQKVVENFDDLSAPVRRLQDELIDRKGGSALSDQQDFYTRKRLYPGRVATETQGFNKAYLDPMVEFMRKRDISLDQAANYVEAMHVGERNAYIGKMYPAGHQFNKAMSDKKVIGGSGRSQEWADNVIADAARTNKTRDLNRVHDYIQAIRHFILNKLVNGHLLTPEEARQWRERYEHYVDLRGYEDNPDDKPSDYREPSQFNVRGKEAQMAMGRTTVANNPIVNMLDQAYRAIDRVEKNRYLHAVWNAFGRAAKDAPGSVSDIVKFDHTKPKKVIDKNTGLVHQVHDNSFVMSPNTVAVKIDGITHYMVFANREVAEAVKRMRPDDVGDFFRGVLRLENKLKAMWTHWSPDFLARHFLARYPIEGAMNSFEQKESGKHSVTKYLRQSYPIVGAAYKAIRAEEAGAKPTGDKDVEELRKYYAEMKQRGGSMAFRQMRDVDLIREHLQHELKALQGSALSNTVYRHEQFVRALDGVTNAMDNALRLSAYASARKQGKTEQQAALLAREATIDFMRKGRLAAKVGIYFPFGNVAINTGSRMARAFYRSKMMRRAIFGMAMAGFTLGMWNYLIGGSDEHGNPYFEKIPTWDREKNFIWLNPFEHDEKGNPQVYKIPNQFNYSLPMNIGYSVATRMFGKEGWLETLSSVAKSAVTAFTPLDEEGNLAALPAPEVARPAVHILTNKNSFGNPIHNDEAFNRGPNAYSGRKDKDGQVRTGSGWKWFAEALNNLSGGDSRHSGYVDVYPESIREAFNYAGQAQGGLLQHLYETLYNAPVNKGQMAEPTQVPIERVFRGNDYDAHDRYEIGHRKFLNKHPWLK